MPTVAAGVEYADLLLTAVREQARSHGVETSARLVSPALVALDEADLARLGERPDGSSVRYDGRSVWINGVDHAVQP